MAERKKIFWVDTSDRIFFFRKTIRRLEKRGHYIREYPWETTDCEKEAKLFRPDIVVIHFDQRSEARPWIKFFKGLGCKVFVFNISTILLEEADAVIRFFDYNDFVNLIEKP